MPVAVLLLIRVLLSSFYYVHKQHEKNSMARDPYQLFYLVIVSFNYTIISGNGTG